MLIHPTIDPVIFAIGPVAGQLSNRIGNGGTMVLGSLVFALAIALTLVKSIFAIVAALVLVCAGFFSIHAAAAAGAQS